MTSVWEVSADGVRALLGQNGSGKSSGLQLDGAPVWATTCSTESRSSWPQPWQHERYAEEGKVNHPAQGLRAVGPRPEEGANLASIAP